MAALFFVSEPMCRSRQFAEAFSSPPVNQRAKGGFHSSTLSHRLCQTRFPACSPQNFSGSARASFDICSSVLTVTLRSLLSLYSLDGSPDNDSKCGVCFKNRSL